MIRSAMIAITIGVLAGPALAKGGGSDIQHDREKLQAAKEKAGKKSQTPAPSFFQLIFGGDKKPDNRTK